MNFFFLSMIFLWGGNEYVKIVSPSQSIIVDEKNEARFILYLVPVKGIHINGEPAPVFKPVAGDTTYEIIVLKSPDVQKSKNFSILDTRSPFVLKIRFKDSWVASVNREERLQIVYFYCSDTEGWCSRGFEEIEIQLNRK